MSAIRADTPWRRLPWLTPMALVLLLAALIGFQHILGGRLDILSPLAPVELSIIEPPPAPPPAVATPTPEPAPPEPLAAQPLPPAPSERAVQPPPAAPAPPEAAPAPPVSVKVPAAPPAKQEPAPQRGRSVAGEMQELSRHTPGMITEPLNRRPPLSAEERKRLDELYTVGRGTDGTPVEAWEGPQRAARSDKLPPLTKEQWATLDRIYRVGRGTALNPIEAEEGPRRAARSERLPPLTKEQWATLDTIYHVGFPLGNMPPEANEAGLRGALSVRTAFTMPSAVAIEPGRPAGAVAHNGMAAHAVEQPMPSIPPELQLPAGELVAVARFQVAADGATTVDLTGPTSEPKLNDLLLATLRTWRFTPAYQSGRAVPSTLELRLTISVP